MESSIRYIPLGDSYTSGSGVEESERFPNQLARALSQKNIPIELIANPAQEGWTTKQVLDFELPSLRREKATFTTLLIGTNDWKQEVAENEFASRFSKILDELEKFLGKNMAIFTLADFSISPVGRQMAKERDITLGMQSFNKIISQEAIKRELLLIDLFAISKTFDSTCFSDGLHPSAKGYAKWIDHIISPISSLLR